MFWVSIQIVLLVATATHGNTSEELFVFPDNRISGGTPAKDGDYPSQAPTITTLLRAGIINLDSDTGGSLHRVTETIRHENYDAARFWLNDIAVVRVRDPFNTATLNVKSISLPDQGKVTDEGSSAIVIGWGGEKDDGYLNTILEEADVNITEQKKCKSIYANAGIPLDSTHILCAGGENITVCTGDYGGPLLVNETVVGLISYTHDCSNALFDVVCTQVANFRTWITEKTGA